jgi:hypothetical protein
MATERGRRREKAPGTSIGRAGSVLSAAWSELLALVLEVGGRKAGETVIRALTPVQDTPSGAIDALIESYRQYLGEMASALPAIGRYLTAQTKPEAQSVGRLLLQLSPGELPKQNAWRLSARVSEEAGEVGRLYTTKATIDALRKAADENLEPGHKPLGELLSRLAILLGKIDEINLARVLEELKYDFRRRGFEAISNMRTELDSLLNPDLQQLYATFDSLAPALGELVTQRILSNGLLDQYALAEKGEGQWTDSVKAYWIPGDPLLHVQERFQAIGIELSERMSVVAGRHDGLILDHEHDAVYEVRYFEDRYDVYGAREGRRYKIHGGHGEILLPVRVMDAAQGLVVWSIDKRIVQEQLDVARTKLEAWDTGAGRTPIILSVADHREGDLGAYAEITLGCLATPPDNPLAVGMWMLSRTPVTSDRAQAASETIWGFQKTPAHIEVRYRGKTVTWKLREKEGSPLLLKLTLPRGGEVSSMSIPMLVYTTKATGSYTLSSLNRTLVIRNGQGEQVRGGGTGVSLSVPGREAGTISDMLRRLGLVNDAGERARLPIFSVWTEHASGEAYAPALVIVPTDMT